MPLLHFNLSMASCSTWNKIQTIITCEVFYVLTPEFLSALISYHSAHYAPLTLASFLCLKHTELSPLQAGLCPECFSCSSSHGWLIAASSSFRSDQISPCQKDLPQPSCPKVVMRACVCCAELLSRVWLLATPWTAGILSMKLYRQESWSGLPFPIPGDRPDPRIESVSPILAGKFFTTVPPGKSTTERYPVCYSLA